MKIFYHTFGCKVNQYETENIRQKFLQSGFADAKSCKDADVCFVNSCTVTAEADAKLRQFIRKVKKSNPDCIIILAGCFAQAFPDKAAQFHECDIVIGAKDKGKVPQRLLEFLNGRRRVVSIPSHEKGELFEPMQNLGSDKTRAFIKIQDGCDMGCSYCIIPKARGHIRSKPLDELKKEAAVLARSGHKEIVLTGINLCCYGKETKEGYDLADAVKAVSECCSVPRIRLGSLEPEMMSNSIIKKLSEVKNFCPQFHLSLQSGCDKTLKAMNRKYTAAEYETICLKLRRTFPDCAITTDIMVGFPGETEEDFAASLEFVRKIGFAKAHIFPYSAREGTAAALLEQISGDVKALRAKHMELVCRQSEREFLQTMVGKTVSVLFERENCTDFHQGYSENYTQIKIPRENCAKSLRRMIFCVKIEESYDDFCLGRITDEKA